MVDAYIKEKETLAVRIGCIKLVVVVGGGCRRPKQHHTHMHVVSFTRLSFSFYKGDYIFTFNYIFIYTN